jgi:hypothetical protein
MTSEFFRTNPLQAHRIPVNNGDMDLRNDVADRIYDIRCRIVHAKSESEYEAEPLLPFSKESQEMSVDIVLVRFVARKVLIASGTPLSIG